MTIGDVVQDIRDNIVSQLSFKKDDDGNHDNTDALIRFINRAQRVVNTDLSLKLNNQELIVPDTDSPSIQYTLNSDFVSALSATNALGHSVPINDPTRANSIFIDEFEKIVEVSNPIAGVNISIEYIAALDDYTYDDIANNKIFAFPSELMELLYQQVGYLAYLSINPTMQAENNTYYLRYASALSMAKSGGYTTIEDYIVDRRLAAKGFV